MNTLLSKPRTNKRGGGVGMFVSTGLNFKLRDDLHMNSASCGFESLFIEVQIQKNAIIVGTIYKGNSPGLKTNCNFIFKLLWCENY